MATRHYRRPDLTDYQKEWDAMLGRGDGRYVWAGIIMTMIFFACLISMPWIISTLQDAGILKPRIYFNEELELNNHLHSRTEKTMVVPQAAPASLPTGDSPFGKPNQE